MVALIACVLIILLAIATPLLNGAGVLHPYTFHNELVGGLGRCPPALGGMGWSHLFGVEPAPVETSSPGLCSAPASP